MFETLKRLYDAGRLTADMLTSAVARGYISQGQANEIGFPAKKAKKQ